MVHCIDAKTGNRVFRARVPGGRPFWASPWSFDGRVFALDDAGTVHVIEPGQELSVLRRNEIGERVWSTPAQVREKAWKFRHTRTRLRYPRQRCGGRRCSDPAFGLAPVRTLGGSGEYQMRQSWRPNTCDIRRGDPRSKSRWLLPGATASSRASTCFRCPLSAWFVLLLPFGNHR